MLHKSDMCQGTPYFTSHFQPLQPPLQYFLQHSSLHPSTSQIPLITSLWHNSNASACPPLTMTSWLWLYDLPPFLHLFTFSHLFLCRYISAVTLLTLLLLWFSPFSLVIQTYLSYSHFSHITPFNYLISFHFYFIYLLFQLTPYLVLKPHPSSSSFRTSC